ncbi:MAG: hypothetical protein M3Z23_16880 [Acidobacteriota bacterium]|nr:hypothetical protein [Acidobacteriota bacterium]
MRSRSIAFFAVVCVAAAQSFSAPRVGFVLDASHRVRPVFGVAGNLILGEALLGDGEFLSFAFSGKSGLAKTATQILLLDSEAATIRVFDAPPGQAFFAFHPDGTPAYCYFQASGDLVRIGPNGLEPLERPLLADGLLAIGVAENEGTPEILTAGLTAEVHNVQQMGDGWTQISRAKGTYALRTVTGTEYRLPEPVK